MRFVFLTSPFVGPGAWRAGAHAVMELGYLAHVVDFRTVITAAGPDVAEARRAVERSLGDAVAGSSGPFVLVAHSGAGLLVPTLVQQFEDRVAGAVFVDAGLPDAGVERVVVAGSAFREELASRTDADGMLPPWFGWWEPDAMAALVPDPELRRVLEGEMPAIPLSYLAGSVPVPRAWPSVPSAYLAFGGEAYAEEVERARAWGWPVSMLHGAGHLHMAVDPTNVARDIIRLAESVLD